MNKTSLRIYNKIRITISRMKGRDITACGKTLLSPNTELSVLGKLKIGNGVISERGVFLAVRNGSCLQIGAKTYINRNTCIVARNAITIGNNVKIAPNVCIYDHDHSDRDSSGYISSPIIIEDNVWIGSNCVVLKGVTIGANSVIAAGSVITHNVPRDTIVYQKKNSTFVSIT